MEDKFCMLADDLVANILSRLPPKPLGAFKCTCKRWYKFVSNPTFTYIHGLRTVISGYPKGVFVQQTYHCCDRLRDLLYYGCLEKRTASDKLLDFLPVRTALVSSSNGILCCRNINARPCSIASTHNMTGIARIPACEKSVPLVIYLCNPATREWITLKPPQGINLDKASALSFDLNGPSFILVGIQHSEDKLNWCSFVIYSSKLKIWRVSKEFHCFASDICPEKHVFLNGRCHWIIETFIGAEDGCALFDYRMLIFDINKESCQVVMLPHISPRKRYVRKCCLGVWDGHVYYVCGYQYSVRFWRLKDYQEPLQWVPCEIKFPPVPEFVQEYDLMKGFKGFPIFDTSYVAMAPEYPSSFLKPVYLHNNLLFLSVRSRLGCYNLSSREYVPEVGIGHSTCREIVFVPYVPTIAPLKCLEGSLIKGCSSSRRAKRRKTILQPKRSPTS